MLGVYQEDGEENDGARMEKTSYSSTEDKEQLSQYIMILAYYQIGVLIYRTTAFG